MNNIEKYEKLVIDKNYCRCNELNAICAGNREKKKIKNFLYDLIWFIISCITLGSFEFYFYIFLERLMS